MYSIGQLSKKTGVTVRTLDYYDEIGLITPSSTTEGGHRLYDEQDVMRLEQILALKYMGFSLQQIHEILDQSTVSWEQSLENQLKMVHYQQEQLEKLERALQGILYSIRFEEDVKWPIIFDIIHLFQQDKDTVERLFESYFNPEEYQTIQNLNKQVDGTNFHDWKEIIHDARANIYTDPGSEKAQQIATRWMDKVDEMFSGNKKMEAKMWEMIKNNTDEYFFYPMDRKVINFIDRATSIMLERKQASMDRSGKEKN